MAVRPYFARYFLSIKNIIIQKNSKLSPILSEVKYEAKMSNKMSEEQKIGMRSREFILDFFERAVKQKEIDAEQRSKQIEFGSAEQLTYATWALVIFQVMMIILFATVGGNEEVPETAPGGVLAGYNMFIGVEIMM